MPIQYNIELNKLQEISGAYVRSGNHIYSVKKFNNTITVYVKNVNINLDFEAK